jgi:hypothetical protein
MIKRCVFILISFAACHSASNEEVVATIGDHQLAKSTLVQAMPSGLKGNDSTLWAHQWIENWAANQLLLDEANKMDDPIDLELKLNQYEEQLKIEALKNSILQQQFDEHSINASSQQIDSTSGLSQKEMASEIKKLEIWQTYQNSLIQQAKQSGNWNIK